MVRSFGASRITQDIRLASGGRRVDIATEVDWQESEKVLKAAFRSTSTRACPRPRSSSGTWTGPRTPTPAGTRPGSRSARTAGCGSPSPATGRRCSTTPRTGTTSPAPPTPAPTARACWAPPCGSRCCAPAQPGPRDRPGHAPLQLRAAAGRERRRRGRGGLALNLPLRTVAAGPELPPLVAVDNPAITVEAVKLAEDRSGDVVVRLYESSGGRAAGTLITGFPCCGRTWRT
ncbi:glycoside hydrolase family 38 C-terminal domain-containing protein [Streptomyces sp. M19]